MRQSLKQFWDRYSKPLVFHLFESLFRKVDTFILMGDFNAQFNGDADLINKGEIRYLSVRLLLCLAIMNTFFQHRNIHICTSYHDGLQQKSLIDSVMVPEGIKGLIGDVRVMRGAELSTDHHLVLCEL